MSLNQMVLCSNLKNCLWKIVTKSQVVTKFNVTKLRLHCIHRYPKKQVLWCVFVGLTIKAQPSPALSEKLPKWHFLPMHVIQKFLGPNHFFWSALKVPPCDFIQNMSQALSKCLKQWIKVDKLNYFKNAS